MTLTEYMLRLGCALGCGMVIGIERQFHHKSAGLKTNTLVALGAAVYVLLSIQLADESGTDVTRIIGQVVTGVGFLGAGVILHQGATVQGLTTAATIWCSSAVGCLAAAGYYAEAGITSLLIVVINYVLRSVDKWVR